MTTQTPSNDEMTTQKPVVIHNRLNAKIARAVYLVNKNQVEYSSKYRYFTVLDENKRAWIVKLYPPSCTCTLEIISIVY